VIPAVATLCGRARSRPAEAPVTRVPDRLSSLVLRAPALPGERQPAATALRVAFLLDSLEIGGVQRMTLALARELVARGYAVDVLVCRPEGSLGGAVPSGVRLVMLPAGKPPLHRLLRLWAGRGGLLGPGLPILLARPHWTLRHLGALAGHLARERPAALLTATPRLNLLAAWARRLAGGRIRLLVSERTAPTQNLGNDGKWRKRALLPGLMRRAYGQADAVVAVSDGVADDLARVTGLPRGRIRTIHNPVVGPELEALSREPVRHPWLAPGQPPVVLSAARLTVQKDLPTLLRAFALLRARRAVRLLILGDLPGFTHEKP
jgi:glycosyltransferase involved in cell wall biosynthesis